MSKDKKEKLTKPSEGYFKAKREMQDSLDHRLGMIAYKINKCRQEDNYTGITLLLIEQEQLEGIRNYVRNGMLWDTENGL